MPSLRDRRAKAFKDFMLDRTYAPKSRHQGPGWRPVIVEKGGKRNYPGKRPSKTQRA